MNPIQRAAMLAIVMRGLRDYSTPELCTPVPLEVVAVRRTEGARMNRLFQGAYYLALNAFTRSTLPLPYISQSAYEAWQPIQWMP